MDSSQLEELNTRVTKLERRDVEDLLVLLEIMSNATFFGGMKKTDCEYAINGQCSLFHLQTEAKNKIPIATECRIPECDTPYEHYHLETSNITCTFCPQGKNDQSSAKKQR